LATSLAVAWAFAAMLSVPVFVTLASALPPPPATAATETPCETLA